MKTVIKRTYLVTLGFFLLIFTVSNTFAYWASSLISSSTQSNQQVGIGQWDFNNPNLPLGIQLYVPNTGYTQGTALYYEGNYYFAKVNTSTSHTLGEGNGYWAPYNQYTLNYVPFNSYVVNQYVYHEASNAYYYAFSNEANANAPVTSNHWYRVGSIEFVTYNRYPTGSIVEYNGSYFRRLVNYDIGALPTPANSQIWKNLLEVIDWQPQIYAQSGTVVKYNGIYYSNSWYAQANDVPGTGQNWKVYNATFTTPNNFTNGKVVEYQGSVYRLVNQANRNSIPGTQPNSWNKINTLDYHQYNIYALNDIVLYNGGVYRVVNATNANNHLPGTFYNAWNRLDSITYQPNNVYTNNDLVLYNNLPYIVVNATNANGNTPGTIANGWNLLGSLEYQWFNLYKSGDFIIYNNVAYRANQNVVNELPSTSNKWTALG